MAHINSPSCLFVIAQELLDLFPQIGFRAGRIQKRCSLRSRPLQGFIKQSLRPLPLVRGEFHSAFAALRTARTSR
jgi:hypothetical protein